MPSLVELGIDAGRVMESAQLRSATVYDVLEKDGLVVAGVSSGHLVIWYPSGEWRRMRVGSAVYCLTLMNDEALLCACDQFVALYSWSTIVSGEINDKPAKHWQIPASQLPTAEANCILWDATKERIFIGAGDGGIYCFDPSRFDACALIASVSSNEMVLDLHLKKNILAAACDDGSIALLDPRKKQAIHKTLSLALNQQRTFCTCVSLDPTANWVTAAGGIEDPTSVSSSSGALATFHVSSGSVAHATSIDAPVRAMASRPDTEKLFLATDIGLQTFDIWGSSTSFTKTSNKNIATQFKGAGQVRSPAVLTLLDDSFCRDRLSHTSKSFSDSDLGYGNGGAEDLGPIPTFLVAGLPATYIDICTPYRHLFSLRHDMPPPY
uniref:Anaphase-promoting complex subunit 4 WD40 domain-containing protein n=1 Tax=Aureoumbra lagunensis TaxID=44058 RepID=A0A7S3K3U7_9STRA|mmetsp:Transcript_18171/g.27422  ORF Transcript_18171/g.27422 Transcript_18171/m.27422 type:complete len:381 (-) Transcript_18171:12-1154(-)